MRTKLFSGKGTSFIDIVISLGIIATLFWGIYLVYFSLIDSVSNIEARTAATEMLNQQIEIIRDLPYAAVGTVSGIPSGNIPQQQSLSLGTYTFTVNTTVRNIDDPFDGTLANNTDAAPADYKLVELQVSCPTCAHFVPLTFTTTIAPKALENASSTTGSLFITVLDAGGNGIHAITVHVKNASLTPSVDLTDTTNASGVLVLVGVPTSTQTYHIDVSRSGYSSDRTYPLGAASNPHPVKPDATVSEEQVTSVSFAVDALSALNVRTSDAFCVAAGNKNFNVHGSKLIGLNPTVLKYSATGTTNASGAWSSSTMEWDSYTFTLNSADDVAGTIPLSPASINPTSSNLFRFVLRPAAPDSLLVSLVDAANGAVIPGATVTLSKAGYASTLTTGHITVTDTNWSGGNYSSQDGGIDVDSNPGTLQLPVNASGTYDTTTAHWLISNTIDVGSSTATYYALSWNPVIQPGAAGPNSVAFRLAANNDNATWNFVGPDGTGNTYYTASSTIVGLNDNRYIRYKVYLSTVDENTTPSVSDVSLDLYAACVPPSQALFQNLASGNYTLDITAPGYLEATSSVSVASAWQETKIQLTPQ